MLLEDIAPPAWPLRLGRVFRSILARPSGAIGAAIVVLQLLMALSAPWLATHDPTFQNPAASLQAPGGDYVLGTDQLGRDVLSRTLMGGRAAIAITGLATLLAVLGGGALGITIGFLGGRIEESAMWLIDACLALPWLLFLLLAASASDGSLLVLIPLLAFFHGIPLARVVRAATLSVVAQDYVTAARARGHHPLAIVWHDLLPNIRDVLLVEGAMRWSWMLLVFSSLSFLGFGVTPPTPDWGAMIAEARGYLGITPWVVLWPCLALSSLVIGINLLGDALGKALGLDRMLHTPV
ncbi:ABC transporter permease [Mesorhizobium sp. IMUNJ 23033]|uniref:ABC transporter permease n=1 Tax=Mesorhizobium sp. IMUNJ 23033 TaxID=3378039 RepID=UPI00384DE00E